MEKMLRDLEVESNMIMTWNGMEFDLILTIICIILTNIMTNIAMIMSYKSWPGELERHGV